MTKKEAIATVSSILDMIYGDSKLDAKTAKMIVEALPIKGVRNPKHG